MQQATKCQREASDFKRLLGITFGIDECTCKSKNYTCKCAFPEMMQTAIEAEKKSIAIELEKWHKKPKKEYENSPKYYELKRQAELLCVL